MRSQQIKFKNPFDLMDEETDTFTETRQSYHQSPKLIQAKRSHTLPFNPYVISSDPIAVTAKPEISLAYNSEIVDHSPIRAFKPQAFNYQQRQQPRQHVPSSLNEDGDPPLLEDLGIDVKLIRARIFAVLRVSKPDTLHEPDMSGPIAIGLTLGVLLLMSGKVQFGDIYAMFILGNVLIYGLFNFMSQTQIIPLYHIMSTLGYALLPMLLLGGLGIFLQLRGSVGIVLGLALAAWSSFAASHSIEVLLGDQHSQRRMLLVYPLFLFYVSFCLIYDPIDNITMIEVDQRLVQGRVQFIRGLDTAIVEDMISRRPLSLLLDDDEWDISMGRYRALQGVFECIEVLQIRSLRMRWNDSIGIIKQIQHLRFPNLKELFLNGNSIANMEALVKIGLPRLSVLNLKENNVVEVRSLRKCQWGGLRELMLYKNKIKEMGAVGAVDCAELKRIWVTPQCETYDGNCSLEWVLKMKPTALTDIYVKHHMGSNLGYGEDIIRSKYGAAKLTYQARDDAEVEF